MFVGNQNQLFFAVQAHIVQRFGCFNGFMPRKGGIHFAVQLVGKAAAQKQGGKYNRNKMNFCAHGNALNHVKWRGFYAFSGCLKRIQSKRLYAVLKRFSGCIQGQSSGFFRNSYHLECKQLFHVVFLSTKFTQFEKYNKKTTRFR